MPHEWAECLNGLGTAYINRIQGDRSENIEKAISFYRDALEVRTHSTSPLEWAQTMNNLGATYVYRILGSRSENIEQAIIAIEKVLGVVSFEDSSELWVATLQNLANAYNSRTEGDLTDNIELAISYCNQAIGELNHKGRSIEWASLIFTLGNLYLRRSKGRQIDNVEQAISYYKKALEVFTCQNSPEQWAQAQANLAMAYTVRIQDERLANLVQAAVHCNQALEVYTRDAYPIEWAEVYKTLAQIYIENTADPVNNLEKAIHYAQQALTLENLSSFRTTWIGIHQTLGEAFAYRAHGKKKGNLEQAIYHFQLALDIATRHDFSDYWHRLQNDLAITYSNRIAGDKTENLEQAIVCYEQALKIRTRESMPVRWALTQQNLASAYADRIKGDRTDNIKQAIFHYKQSLEIRTRETNPREYRWTKRNLGDLYFREGDWKAAIEIYSDVLDVGQGLFIRAYTESGRQIEVSENGSTYVHIAYAHLKLKQYDQALISLEHGKAQLLAEVLNQADYLISQLPQKHRLAIRKALKIVRDLEIEIKLASGKHNQRSLIEINTDLANARTKLKEKLQSAEKFIPNLLPKHLSLEAILALPEVDSALIFPIFTSQGSAIIVIPYGLNSISKDNIVWINHFREEDLKKLLINAEENIGWLDVYSRWRSDDCQEWFSTIDSVSHKLWDTIIQPLYSKLQSLNARTLTILPQGGLQLLPIHAGWRVENDKKRYLLDDYRINYAPSCKALESALKARDSVREVSTTLLAISNPTQDLPFTPAEVTAIAMMFPQGQASVIEAVEATHTEILKRNESPSTFFHFSGHGTYNWDDPQESGLVCSDKILSLHTIQRRMNLSQTRLVCLSACETGMVDIRQSPDEFIGLPAGFMAAGAPTVVSSLWPVSDLSTMLLMERFYANYLSGIDLFESLREAQLWLRDVCVDELVIRFSAERGKSADKRVISYDQASSVWRQFSQMNIEDRPFAHPFYWAAFTFTGV